MFNVLHKNQLNEIIITKEDIINNTLNNNFSLQEFLDLVKEHYLDGLSVRYTKKDNKRYVLWSKNSKNILLVDINDFIDILHTFTKFLFTLNIVDNNINVNFVFGENKLPNNNN